jgi:hypothetical protein
LPLFGDRLVLGLVQTNRFHPENSSDESLDKQLHDSFLDHERSDEEKHGLLIEAQSSVFPDRKKDGLAYGYILCRFSVSRFGVVH